MANLMANGAAKPAPDSDAEAHRGPPSAGGGLRRFWQVATPYWNSEEKWRARGLVAILVVLAIAQVAIQVRLNAWNADFFNALDARDSAAFLRQIWLFCLIAGGSMAVAVYQLYFKVMLLVRWRRWLTQHLVERWIGDGRHYQLGFMEGEHDNPDQRIAEDVALATRDAVEFGTGLLNSALMLVAFVGILWTLSGALSFSIGSWNIEIWGYMVWVAIGYAVLGSTLTWLLGRPLVAINTERHAREGDFRFGLMRVRENSESIALMRGETDERRSLFETFEGTLRSWGQLMKHQARLTWLTSGYALAAMVFPVLVAAPRYFAGALTLGGLMQTAAAFQQVQAALSWFVDMYPRIADWNACIDRILGFSQAIDDLEEDINDPDDVSIVISEGEEELLLLRDLDIAQPDGIVVVNGANSDFAPGEKVLIVGESGSGKSTLLRAVAGLWPWGRGKILIPPSGKIMFMPQRPYLPLGSLRACVAYPSAPDSFSDAAIRDALGRCGLEHVAGRLDEEERWDKTLSLGEQQRLAFARLLLHKPDWVFMDEATAALDEDNQAAMMGLFKDELAKTTLISIGHRPGLDAFHERTLTLVRSETGARLVKGARLRREARRAQEAAARERVQEQRRIRREAAAIVRRWLTARRAARRRAREGGA